MKNSDAERLFNDNIALAYFARNRYGWMFRGFREISPEDVTQICLLALWNAALHFDGSRGCLFSTFAVSHMRGEMKKALRSAMREARFCAVSIDAYAPGEREDGSGECNRYDIPSPEDVGIAAAAVSDLNAFIFTLPERTRRVLACREAGMRQAEIGRALGISQVHVSRILRQAAQAFRSTDPEGENL